MHPARGRERLARERTRIEGDLATRERQGRLESSDRREPGDEGSENLYEDELDEARREQLQNELATVVRAEVRIADDTYGVSVESGKPVPDERLEVLPTAERTVDEDELY